jgi:hypothetical protein
VRLGLTGDRHTNTGSGSHSTRCSWRVLASVVQHQNIWKLSKLERSHYTAIAPSCIFSVKLYVVSDKVFAMLTCG